MLMVNDRRGIMYTAWCTESYFSVVLRGDEFNIQFHVARKRENVMALLKD